MASQVIHFVLDKETKNTFRYNAEEGASAIVNMVYVAKEGVPNAKEPPAGLTITVVFDDE